MYSAAGGGTTLVLQYCSYCSHPVCASLDDAMHAKLYGVSQYRPLNTEPPLVREGDEAAWPPAFIVKSRKERKLYRSLQKCPFITARDGPPAFSSALARSIAHVWSAARRQATPAPLLSATCHDLHRGRGVFGFACGHKHAHDDGRTS